MAVGLALLAPFFFSLCNLIDKHFVSEKYESDIWTYAVIVSLVGSPFLFIIGFFNFFLIIHNSFWVSFIAILSGFIITFAFIFYYYALTRIHATGVAIYFGLIPVFSFILGLLFFHEDVELGKIGSSLLIVIGALLFNFDFSRKDFKKIIDIHSLGYMALCSFLISISYILFKFVSVPNIFWANIFYDYVGSTMFGFVVLLLVRKTRNGLKNFFIDEKKNNFKQTPFFSANELFNLGGMIASRYAILFLPVFLVNSIGRTQTLMVYLLELLWILFIRENKKELKSLTTHIPLKVVSLLFVISGLIFLG